MRLRDFDLQNGTVVVRISKSGHVVLAEAGSDLFQEIAAGKAADDLLLTRQNGEPWGRNHQHRPLRAACRRAGISPAISFHVLRHTYASQLAMAGVPLQVLAANLGHADARMTERHYAHLAPAFVANTIRSALQRLARQD